VAAQYSADSPDLQKIAREAEVDLVLTGALLQLGERLRITSQLVEVRSGTLLWSHSSQATIRELLERVRQRNAPSASEARVMKWGNERTAQA
jgi:TolB-like protein